MEKVDSRKFVRYKSGAELYDMSQSIFERLAKEAKATVAPSENEVLKGIGDMPQQAKWGRGYLGPLLARMFFGGKVIREPYLFEKEKGRVDTR